LFDETQEQLTGEPQFINEQIVFEQEGNWQPLSKNYQELNSAIDDVTLAPEKTKKSSLIAKAGLFAFGAIAVIELADFFTAGFVQSPIVTSLWTVVLASVTVLAGASTFKEFTTLKQLKRQQHSCQLVSEQLEQHLAKKVLSSQQALALCEKIHSELAYDVESQVAHQWQAKELEQLSAAEIFNLFNHTVLAQVDKQALQLITNQSAQTSLLVALSPIAVIDMLIVVYRNLAMVNKIAGLYGVQLGYWSRIKLLRQVFKYMVFAGATELATDISFDLLGAEHMGRFSGRLAQGVATGLLSVRLGLQVVHNCRPMPLDKKSTMNLAYAKQELLGQLKRLVLKKK
jgi:putative membrane protein